MTSTTPGTVPSDSLRVVRRGRHAVAEPRPPEPGYALSLFRLMAQALDPAPVGDHSVIVQQRIVRDHDQLRRLRRALPEIRGSQQRFETEASLRALRADGSARKRALGGLIEQARTRNWGPSDFVPGDQARYLSAWYEVVRVGPSGLTVRFRRPRDGRTCAVPIEYPKVTGRRRDGVDELDAA